MTDAAPPITRLQAQALKRFCDHDLLLRQTKADYQASQQTSTAIIERHRKCVFDNLKSEQAILCDGKFLCRKEQSYQKSVTKRVIAQAVNTVWPRPDHASLFQAINDHRRGTKHTIQLVKKAPAGCAVREDAMVQEAFKAWKRTAATVQGARRNKQVTTKRLTAQRNEAERVVAQCIGEGSQRLVLNNTPYFLRKATSRRRSKMTTETLQSCIEEALRTPSSSKDVLVTALLKAVQRSSVVTYETVRLVKARQPRTPTA